MFQTHRFAYRWSTPDLWDRVKRASIRLVQLRTVYQMLCRYRIQRILVMYMPT